MNIIEYTPHHKQSVIDLSLAAWAPVFTGIEKFLQEQNVAYLFDQWYKGDWQRVQAESVAATLADANTSTWVATALKVTGFVSVKLDDAEATGEIYMIAVLPGYQGQGIAGRLIEFATGYMKTAGMKLAMIGTGLDEGHAPARKLYEKQGFRLVPTAYYFKDLQ